MTTANPPVQSASPDKGLLARHPLVFYFLIAYAGTWLVSVPFALSGNGVGLLPFGVPDGSVIFISAAWIFLGPTLAAFIMTGITEGRAGIRRLLRRIVLWRVGLRWYLFAFIGVSLVITLGFILVGGLASLQFLGLGYVLTYLVTFIIVLIIGGPLGEEIGWRGFALPRMQPLHGPLVGSIILGLLWGLWHLPEFMVPTWAESSGGSSPLAIAKFCIFAIAVTIILTWVFNNTKGSVLMAVVVHASIDAPFLPFSVLLGPAEVMNSLLVGFGALALVIVALTRGRLGYDHYRQEAEEEPASATAPT